MAYVAQYESRYSAVAANVEDKLVTYISLI